MLKGSTKDFVIILKILIRNKRSSLFFQSVNGNEESYTSFTKYFFKRRFHDFLTNKQAKLFFEMSKTFEATSFRGMEMPRKKIKIRNKVSKKICFDNHKTSYDNLNIILKV
jgi:hypothetical protein